MSNISKSFSDFLITIFGEHTLSDFFVSSLLLLLIFMALTLIKLLLLRIVAMTTKTENAFLKMIVNWLYFISLVFFSIFVFSDFDFLNRTLFTIGEAKITIFVLLIVSFIIFFSVKLSSFSRNYLLPKAYDKYQLDVSTRFTFNSAIHYLILVIAILISINALGINLTSFTVFAGIFGVGIGFGMQNIVSNFISGIILLFERPIKVGDTVILDSVLGEVVDIKIRATIVRTLDNEHIIVPNSLFLEEKIVNRSYGDLTMRTIIDVGVSYDSDVRLVEKLLYLAVENVAMKTGKIITKPETIVRFVEFAESSLNFKVFVWVDHPMSIYLIRSDLHFEILRLFKENDIQIPFPQRDVHMK